MNTQTRVFQSGYRRYEGDRRGATGTFFSIYRLTLKRSFGLGRGTAAKIFPFLIIAIAFLPAIVLIGIDFFVADFQQEFQQETGTRETLVSGYFGFIGQPLFLFASFLAPEALSADRRSGVLSIYLASGTTRMQYVSAKALAVITVMLSISLGPTFLLFLASIFTGSGPDGFGETLVGLGRVLGAGATVGVIYASVGVFFAALTDKRTIASAGAVFTFVATAIGATLLTFALDLDWPGFLNPGVMAGYLKDLIFGLQPQPLNFDGDPLTLDTWEIVAGAVAWGLIGYLVAFIRYRRIEAK